MLSNSMEIVFKQCSWLGQVPQTWLASLALKFLLIATQKVNLLGPASTVEEHSLRNISLGETMVRDPPYTKNYFQTR